MIHIGPDNLPKAALIVWQAAKCRNCHRADGLTPAKLLCSL